MKKVLKAVLNWLNNLRFSIVSGICTVLQLHKWVHYVMFVLEREISWLIALSRQSYLNSKYGEVERFIKKNNNKKVTNKEEFAKFLFNLDPLADQSKFEEKRERIEKSYKHVKETKGTYTYLGFPFKLELKDGKALLEAKSKVELENNSRLDYCNQLNQIKIRHGFAEAPKQPESQKHTEDLSQLNRQQKRKVKKELDKKAKVGKKNNK